MIKNYIYQQENRYFAQVAHKMEELAKSELVELGATEVKISYRGVHFNADTKVLYKIIYCSRIISRVLAPLSGFSCHNEDYLYKMAKQIEWTELLGENKSFAIFANVANSKISNSRFATYRLKDAIVDYYREKYNKRPEVDPKNPDVWLSLYINRNDAVISLDISGNMHRRKYRLDNAGGAPMKETLAAAIVKLSGWKGENKLIDPMCGSGTIVGEALMVAANIPAGYLRENPGISNLPEFNSELWERVKNEENGKIKELPDGLIEAGDNRKRALGASRKNLGRLPGGKNIQFHLNNFKNLGKLEGYTLIFNPPFGVRMGEMDRLKQFFTDIGDYLKQNCTGSTAYIYVGNRELIKSIGLRTSFKKPLFNGNLDGRLVKIELY